MVEIEIKGRGFSPGSPQPDVVAEVQRRTLICRRCSVPPGSTNKNDPGVDLEGGINITEGTVRPNGSKL